MIPGRARRKERLSRSKLKQVFLINSDAELFMYLIQCIRFGSWKVRCLKKVEQNFNPGLAPMGLSGTGPWCPWFKQYCTAKTVYEQSCSTSDPKRSWSVKIYKIENVTVKKTFVGTDQTNKLIFFLKECFKTVRSSECFFGKFNYVRDYRTLYRTQSMI